MALTKMKDFIKSVKDKVSISESEEKDFIELKYIVDNLLLKPTGTKIITANNEAIDVSEYAKVNVNVQPIIESLSVTENGTYTVASGVDGYSPVVVDVPSFNDVIISKIVINSSVGDLTIGGAMMAAQYKLKYKNSEVVFIPRGTNIPSTGNYTFTAFGFNHSGQSFNPVAWESYVPGKSAPSFRSAMVGRGNMQDDNTSTYITTDGTVSNNSGSGSNYFVANGNSLQVIEIPINNNGEIDLTLWDE